MVQSAAEQRINALERLVDTHVYRLDEASATSKEAYKEANQSFRRLEDQHGELKRSVDRETALLLREVEELKKWKEDVKRKEEEWGRKLWMILPPVLAVLVSNAITFLIAVYAKR